MACTVTYNDKKYDVNDFKALLLSGELDRLLEDKKIELEKSYGGYKPPKPPNIITTQEDEENNIDNYEMKTSDEVNKMLSGETIENIFGETPEGEQGYDVQRLTDMLQDGKNMIGIAQRRWGMDVVDYGKNLFQYIQEMSNDKQLSNKKAVLLASFLGDIKEAMLREPNRKNEIQPLYNAVEQYYQRYMNKVGKELAAGRLLRLYRDKYLGDVFIGRILDEKLAKARASIIQAEQEKNITDDIAQQPTYITKEQNKAENKAAKDNVKEAKEKREKKSKISQKEAQGKVADKLKEIKDKVGDKKSLIAKINDELNKLNCK